MMKASVLWQLVYISLITVARGLVPYRRLSRLHHNGIVKSIAHSTAQSDATPMSIGKLIFLVPADDKVVSKFGAASPVGNPLLHEAVRHVAQKANYFADGLLDCEVVSLYPAFLTDEPPENLYQADILVAIGLTCSDEIEFTKSVFDVRRRRYNANQRLCHFALDCAEQIPALVGSYDPIDPAISATLLPWTIEATGKRMHEQMLDLFARWTSDDFCYALMLFLNQFSGNSVEWVKHRTDASWEKGPIRNAREFYAMISECGDCIVPCLKDDKCRECLGKLTQVDPRDQALSYRTLVSYESDLLTKVSLCIFTKKNIFQCDAKIPTIPKVRPIQTWRGQKVSDDDGRALLVGHLDDTAAPSGSLRLPISWKVACGANVAYDQFPSQNQIFYPAVRGRDMWYDPVFRVETLDGRNVWCKRHYKVRPGPEAATFRLSVLDNGVTSDEFWTIVGAADDLSWIVFHYAGAAKVVGLRYLGGLLCTPGGSMPHSSQLPVIWEVLQSAGIQPWELYMVDNRLDTPGMVDAGPPPLEFYRKEILARRVLEQQRA
jgi:VDE lipocalin domain